jgi:hypothetical protein
MEIHPIPHYFFPSPSRFFYCWSVTDSKWVRQLLFLLPLYPTIATPNQHPAAPRVRADGRLPWLMGPPGWRIKAGDGTFELKARSALPVPANRVFRPTRQRVRRGFHCHGSDRPPSIGSLTSRLKSIGNGTRNTPLTAIIILGSGADVASGTREVESAAVPDPRCRKTGTG